MQTILQRNETVRATPNICIDTARARRSIATSSNKKDYVVQVVDTDAKRAATHQLVHDRYAARGYKVSNHIQETQHQTTIAVYAARELAGTATLRIDSSLGLGADAIFKDYIDVHRREGGRLCEITRFAVARGVCSEMVLAAMFHFLYILAFHIQQRSHVFIEVNPRHRIFYKTVFGFECCTGIRTNPRVNAPAYLLQVSTDYLAAQIYYPSNKLIFPRFYSASEEQAIRASFTRVRSMKRPRPGPIALRAQ